MDKGKFKIVSKLFLKEVFGLIGWKLKIISILLNLLYTVVINPLLKKSKIVKEGELQNRQMKVVNNEIKNSKSVEEFTDRIINRSSRLSKLREDHKTGSDKIPR